MDDWDIRTRWAVKYRRIKNFIQEIEQDILRNGIPFDTQIAVCKDAVRLKESIDLKRKKVYEGDVWGKTWDSGYFHLKAQVPQTWEGQAIAAHIDIGGEALVYDTAGSALYGLTSGSAFAEHYAKDVYRLSKKATGGETIEIWLEAAANNLFGVTEAKPPARKDDPDRHGTWEAKIKHLKLCIYDETVWQLHTDMRYLLDLWEDLDEKSVRASRILRALFEVTTKYHENPSNAQLCREILGVELEKPANASALSTTVVGHAHIDTAWLWRIKETTRKTARTFASQLDLLKKYPEYIFGASAPQHHLWIKEEYPDLWKGIKKAAAEGRWEAQGGMWVEADCNLPSGESLVRQFLHGKNFWMDELGQDIRNCWIPDVFGYAGSMPQILRKSGIDFFLTQKLSWSKFNEFPHDTFCWKGIDGTEIVTHFPPEQTYNSYATPRDLRKAETTFHEKDFLDEFITLAGIGDGGGGPKEEHVEHVLRARNLEGVPKASFGRADDLFRRLLEKSDQLKTWTGELYLEYHRGTYTSQAKIKKNNRRLEQEIRAVEGLWTALDLTKYPQEELDQVVKTLLLHQFHDIIPGSSIHDVYVDADKEYDAAFETLEELREKGAATLFKKEEGSLTLYNCLSRQWEGVITLPNDYSDKELYYEEGELVPIQQEGPLVLTKIRIPACGFVMLKSKEISRSANPSEISAVFSSVATTETFVLENKLVKYQFNKDGQIVDAWDKENGCSILKSGLKGNALSLYQDTPHNFDAWDIDFYYKEQFIENATGVSFRPLPAGTIRQGYELKLKCGSSTITQRITLEEASKDLLFRTTVDWNESQKMLRVSFPLDSLASEASCEIAFGHVKRPTHANTEWDFAKFEVCAHRWVDISDAEYGVGLMNDCKYGHSVQDNVLDLTLLRSPLYPDPDADLGRHEFSYVLVPHAGGLYESEIILKGEAMNRPPLLFENFATPVTTSPISFESKGISLEALKKGEKENVWIVRLVESMGRRSRGKLKTTFSNALIAETDLMEWNDGSFDPFESEIEVELQPFEIRSYKIKKVEK